MWPFKVALEFMFYFFKVKLTDIEEYDSAEKFSEVRERFDSDLSENLEIWDNLMKVI